MNDFVFGNFIYKLRRRSGITQTKTAEKLGITNKAVSKWENGFCKIEYDKTTVHNSHGTDVDHELYCSKDYTLEQMAEILENEYSPAAIMKAPAGEKGYYKQDAYSYAPKLREAGTVFAAVQSAGKTFIHEHLPGCEIAKLLYTSSSTAVFKSKRYSGEKPL